MARPFKCARCGNWYTPAERTLDEEQAIDYKPITTGSHRHLDEKPSTYAEVLAGDILAACEAAADAVHEASQGHSGLALAKARDALARAEQGEAEMSQAERFADKIAVRRDTNDWEWYGVPELRQRVGDSRRPPSDLADAMRSARVVPETLAAARKALKDARAGMAAITASLSTSEPPPPAAVAAETPPKKRHLSEAHLARLREQGRKSHEAAVARKQKKAAAASAA